MSDTKEIKGLLDQLSDLYDKHLASFDFGIFPDLEKQSMERKKIFDSLLEKQNDMDHPLWQGELMELNKKNQSLRQRTELEKKSIRKTIEPLFKGKEALSAYRPSMPVKPFSKVMSIKE